VSDKNTEIDQVKSKISVI